MNSAGVAREYSKNFLLDEQKLRKIIDVITEHSKRLGIPFFIKYKLFREDASFYETKDIDEILTDDNTLSKKIRKIDISLFPEDSKKDILFLSFARGGNASVFLEVEYTDKQWCFALVDDLETQIKRTLKTTLKLSPKNYRILDFVFLLFLITFLATYALSKAIQEVPEGILCFPIEEKINYLIRASSPSKGLGASTITGLSLLIISPFIFFVFSPIENFLRFLSSSVFYWGDEKSRYDKKQKVINYLLTGVFSTLILSLFGAYLAKKFWGV